ncbi:prostate stem cell antigen isoform X2 [Paroedura picta]|uniref:prostate stem cell antigen isoform X2 n=1 Tax=Paroedura picta TaxID=143630 RepID=UPI004055F121
MKPLLIFMLAGSLFVPPGSLKCYTCTMQLSNSKCQRETDCDGNATMCSTEILSAVSLLSFITKDCRSSCRVTYKNYVVAERISSCCDADLCNLSGAGAFGTSPPKLAWAVGTSLAWTILRSGL